MECFKHYIYSNIDDLDLFLELKFLQIEENNSINILNYIKGYILFQLCMPPKRFSGLTKKIISNFANISYNIYIYIYI